MDTAPIPKPKKTPWNPVPSAISVYRLVFVLFSRMMDVMLARNTLVVHRVVAQAGHAGPGVDCQGRRELAKEGLNHLDL